MQDQQTPAPTGRSGEHPGGIQDQGTVRHFGQDPGRPDRLQRDAQGNFCKFNF